MIVCRFKKLKNNVKSKVVPVIIRINLLCRLRMYFFIATSFLVNKKATAGPTEQLLLLDMMKSYNFWGILVATGCHMIGPDSFASLDFSRFAKNICIIIIAHCIVRSL